jgi:hypothetical protein
VKESTILKQVMLAATKVGAVVFRNNTGQGWIGRSRRLAPGERYVASGGEVLIHDARPLHAGLFVGSGDLIGWRSIEVTPEMVGRRIATFVSLETKSAKGRSSKEQVNWHDQVNGAGGIALVCKSADDLSKALARIGTSLS